VDWSALAEALGAAQGSEPGPHARHASGWRWRLGGEDLYVKLKPPSGVDEFQAEAAGLGALAAAGCIEVPSVRGVGVAGGHAWLAVEWLALTPASEAAEAALGAALARLHAVTGPAFGWHRASYLGGTPQDNAWGRSWPAFWCQRRLAPMLERLAGRAPGLCARGQRLVERVVPLFAGHHPVPSLLHGDLWGGNWGALSGGRPVVFDPAVYFGDRETDLAMTRLFGGFGPAFYAAYQAEWPSAPGATVRGQLYNLYHLLNHCLLFGGGYGAQAEDCIALLMAETAG
jgi:protein-ribulosamine 3-kinase